MPKGIKPEDDMPKIFHKEPKKFMPKMRQARTILPKNDCNKPYTFCQKETNQIMNKPKIIITSLRFMQKGNKPDNE